MGQEILNMIHPVRKVALDNLELIFGETLLLERFNKSGEALKAFLTYGTYIEIQ